MFVPLFCSLVLIPPVLLFFSRLPHSDSRTLIVTVVELCLCRRGNGNAAFRALLLSEVECHHRTFNGAVPGSVIEMDLSKVIPALNLNGRS